MPPVSLPARFLLPVVLLALPACQIDATTPPPTPDPRPMPSPAPAPTPHQRPVLTLDCAPHPGLSTEDHALLCRSLIQELAPRAPRHAVRLLRSGEAVNADRHVVLAITSAGSNHLSARLEWQDRGGRWQAGSETTAEIVDRPSLPAGMIQQFARNLAQSMPASR